ncbi:MAG TPA: DNA repair protein RecO [Chlamydiales bacterium]|nr:DNA repair protein RecO [Chlamydiales bacterium]
MEEKCQGVLLQSIAYLGKKRILKIVTPEEGLLTLMAKSMSALTTPFCIAEWVYRKTTKEIHPFIDGTLLDPLLELRQNYATLISAGAMAQDLLRSQFPAKKDPALYQLFCAYLKKLPHFSKPEILAASFRLKLLLHEGLLSLQHPSPHFTDEEWKITTLLAYSRQFSLLQEIEQAPTTKIDYLFKEQM